MTIKPPFGDWTYEESMGGMVQVLRRGMFQSMSGIGIWVEGVKVMCSGFAADWHNSGGRHGEEEGIRGVGIAILDDIFIMDSIQVEKFSGAY